ncbi:hypothetical protein QTP88_008021 [Uroleucon formosanum]
MITGPKCYNCQLIEHIARDCTHPKRPLQCSKCGAEGHTVKYCQTVTSDVALIDTNTVNITLYIKRVKINEKSEEVQGLVDTGSALCIIKRSIAQKYGLTIKSRTVNFNVYGNASCVISGGGTKTWLKKDSVKEPVDLLVVDGYIQNYDILIGRTFINKENVSFIKTSNQLMFDYNMPLPYSEESNETITRQLANVEVMLIEREKEPITANMVKHNQSFTKDEVTELVNLMNEYRLCFAFNMFELGCTNALTMDIVDNNVTVVSRPYRASAVERDIIDKIASEWQAAGLVTETKSAYASPVLLVRKKNEALSDAKLFCTLNLASGYLQVPLTEEVKAKTSFIKPNDILIPAKNFEDIINRLRKVLDALKAAKLTLKLEKCYFGYKEVTYLGYKISTEGIKPGMDKTPAIRDMKQLVNQYEVPHYAQIARPLTELLTDSILEGRTRTNF